MASIAARSNLTKLVLHQLGSFQGGATQVKPLLFCARSDERDAFEQRI
jgi:hypothetical protein